MFESLFDKVEKRDSDKGVFLWVCEISRNTFSYGIPPVVGSEHIKQSIIALTASKSTCACYFEKTWCRVAQATPEISS